MATPFGRLLDEPVRADRGEATVGLQPVVARLNLPVGERDIHRREAVLSKMNDTAHTAGRQPPPADVVLPAALNTAVVEPFDPSAFSALPARPMSTVFKHKQKWSKHANTLPITKEKQAIIDAVRTNRLVIVAGDAGSGKSTQVPQILLSSEALHREKTKLRLIVVVPTDEVARAAASRLRDETGESTNVIAVAGVGERARASARVVYTTPLTLLRALAADPLLEHVGCIMIDDAQHRSMALELLLHALRNGIAASQQHATAVGTGTVGLRIVCTMASNSRVAEGTLRAFFDPNKKDAAETIQITTESVDAPTVKLSLEGLVAWVGDGYTRTGLPDAAFAQQYTAAGESDALSSLADLSRLEQLRQDGDFEASPTFARSWGRLIRDTLRRFTGSVADASAVIIVPSALHARIVAEAILQDSTELPIITEATQVPEATARIVAVLDTASFITAAPPQVPYGLLLDAGRDRVSSMDATTHRDRWALEPTNPVALQQRRDYVIRAVRRTSTPVVVATLAADAPRRGRALPEPLSSCAAEDWRQLSLVAAALGDVLNVSPAASVALPVKAGQRSTLLARMVLHSIPSAEDLRGATGAAEAVTAACSAAEAWTTAAGLLQPAPASQDGALPTRRTPTHLGRVVSALPLSIAAAKLLCYGSIFGVLPGACVAAAILTAKGFPRPSSVDAAAGAAAAREYAAGACHAPSDIVADMALYGLLRNTDDSAALADAGCSRKAIDALRTSTTLLGRTAATARLAPQTWGSASDEQLASLVESGVDTPATTTLLSFAIGASLYPNLGIAGEEGRAPLAVVDAASCDGGRHAPTSSGPVYMAGDSCLAPAPGTPVVFDDLSTVVGLTARPKEASLLHEAPAILPTLVSNNASVTKVATKLDEPRAQVSVRRCRGWYPAVTKAWRETNAARESLPPEVQIRHMAVNTQLDDVCQADESIVVADGVVSVHTTASAAYFIGKARIAVKLAFADALTAVANNGTTVGGAESGAPTPMFVGESVAEFLVWLVGRERTAQRYARERRRMKTVAAAKHHLLSAYQFSYATDRLPERRDAAEFEGVKASTTVGGAPGESSSAGPAYHGPRPTDADTAMFVDRAATIAAQANQRSGEQQLLQSDPEGFAFLDFRHPLHGFYLHTLRQLNPAIRVLGDDLLELRQFLADLEGEIRAKTERADNQQHATVIPALQPAPPLHAGPRAVEVTAEYLPQQQPSEPPAIFAQPGPQHAPPTSDFEGTGDGQLATPPPEGALGANEPAVVEEEKEEEEDLMAAILGGAAADAPPTSSSAPPTSGGGLLGNGPLHVALPVAASGWGAVPMGQQHPQHMMPQQHHMMPHPMGMIMNMPHTFPDPMSHPLAKPPPPIPHNPNQLPSVLVEPLPTLPKVPLKDNLPLVLAKALGECLSLRVGPTLIVGNAARITVPNAAVEQRAVAKGVFFCLGQRINVRKNTRIIDNPDPTITSRHRSKHDAIQRGLADTDVPRHLRQLEAPGAGEDVPENRGYTPGAEGGSLFSGPMVGGEEKKVEEEPAP